MTILARMNQKMMIPERKTLKNHEHEEEHLKKDYSETETSEKGQYWRGKSE